MPAQRWSKALSLRVPASRTGAKAFSLRQLCDETCLVKQQPKGYSSCLSRDDSSSTAQCICAPWPAERPCTYYIMVTGHERPTQRSAALLRRQTADTRQQRDAPRCGGAVRRGAGSTPPPASPSLHRRRRAHCCADASQPPQRKYSSPRLATRPRQGTAPRRRAARGGSGAGRCGALCV